MSETFEGYERQYCELSAALSKKCTSASLLDGAKSKMNFSLHFLFRVLMLVGPEEQKKQKISEVQAGIGEAESLIRKMDVEARSLQPNVKAVLLAKLREYKSDLNNLKSEIKRIASTNLNQAARDELLESGLADAETVSADQKGRLLKATERLNKSSDRVRDSRRTMLETEELGVSLLQDLHQQRQSLLHAHGNVINLTIIDIRIAITIINLMIVYDLEVAKWSGWVMGQYGAFYIIICRSQQVSADQKGRLLKATERLNKSSDRVRDSRRTMLETEELGVSLLQDLHQQRQSLLHAHGNVINLTIIDIRIAITIINLMIVYDLEVAKWSGWVMGQYGAFYIIICRSQQLHGVDENISKSKKIMTNISRRMSRNKWIIGSVVAVLIVAIILILYFKLK
ncbi:vesicle transport v-SNARE 13 [Artemisia annua]|uniref:Vesicle transport v-SNARE 13 n=1 Tax=Artemisia annua TaxID=35608 RepID=A0A2U1LBW9_ARTAN|nr:vesicle transport v-SNARE 13 [Artemisia annua]